MPHILVDDYAKCCDPLSGAEPMGQDPKYSDAFQALKGQIGNIDAGTTDWKQAEALAIEVLTTLAKDINTACYLPVILLQRHGYAGLADGMGILRHLVENHWQGLFPRSERTRKFSFEWLGSRLPLFIGAKVPTPEEAPLLQAIADDLTALQGSAREQAEKYKPTFGEIGRSLADLIAKYGSAETPAPEAKTPQKPEATSATPEAATATPEAVTPPSPPGSPTSEEPASDGAASAEEPKADTGHIEPKVLGDDYAKCCDPLPGDEPMGEDPKAFDPFQALKGQIGNIDAGTTDWKQVETLSVEVLTTRAKDINSACYLAVALLQRHGYAGLVDGMGILRHLVENHWQGLFPRSERTRKFSFEWLGNRLPLFIGNRTPTSEEVPLLQAIADDLTVLQRSAREQAEKYKPTFGEIGRNLADLIARHSAPEPPKVEETSKPAAIESTATEPTRAAAPQTPPTTAKPSARDAVELPPAEDLPADASYNEVKGRVRALVGPLRKSNPMSPLGYRVLRALKWDDIDAAPPTESGSQKTKIAAPRTQQSKALEKLHQDQKWQTLLEASEAAFQDGKGTFWLDLQFYTDAALEGLDPKNGGKVAATLRDDFRQLLDRFPRLPQLQFKDGTPFASQQTRQWIEASVVTAEVHVLGGGGRLEESALGDDDLAEARDLFGKKKPIQALEILQQGIDRASHRRSAFQARLAAAQLCFQANHFDWSKSILEHLCQEMEAFEFPNWEPENTVAVYHLLALSYGRLLNSADADLSDDAKDVLADALADIQGRLVRLDLRTVAQIEQTLGPKAVGSKKGLGSLLRDRLLGLV